MRIVLTKNAKISLLRANICYVQNYRNKTKIKNTKPETSNQLPIKLKFIKMSPEP